MSFLSESYKQVLARADQIKRDFKHQPRKLNYLWGIIADLYVDRAKIKGLHNVSSKIPALRNILNNYNFEELVNFFKTTI